MQLLLLRMIMLFVLGRTVDGDGDCQCACSLEACSCRSKTAPGGHDILATVPVATRAHDGAITGLVQTPDARWWVSAGTDNAVRLWSAADRTNSLLRFPGALNSARSMRQIAVDPDSQVCCAVLSSVHATV